MLSISSYADIIPRSVLMVTFGESHYLLCGTNISVGGVIEIQTAITKDCQ